MKIAEDKDITIDQLAEETVFYSPEFDEAVTICKATPKMVWYLTDRRAPGTVAKRLDKAAMLGHLNACGFVRC